jgi:hypothetical protein
MGHQVSCRPLKTSWPTTSFVEGSAPTAGVEPLCVGRGIRCARVRDPPPSWRDGRKPYAALVATVEADAGVAAAGQLDPKQRNDRRMFHNGSPVGATSAPLTGLHLVSFVRHNGFNSARGIWTPLPARTRVRQPRESDARRFHKRRRRCAGVTRCGRRLEPEAPWTERTLCAWRALSTREGAAAARPGFRGRSDTRRSGLPVGCSHPPVQCAGHTGLRRCPWRLVCEARSAAGCPRHDRTTAWHASSKASVTRAQTCRHGAGHRPVWS